jgi:[protein-PII] uridylyltransferase
MFQSLDRPGLLYLALLLHDVGKSEHHKQGRHPEVSAEMAMRAAKRLRLDGPASRLLHTIVENHLLLAGVSQRRDLDDPAVIRQFARQIQTPETLDLLTLLTFADSQGTSDKLWNGFKDLLLWQLHDRAMALLTANWRRNKSAARNSTRISPRCRNVILKFTRRRTLATTSN